MRKIIKRKIHISTHKRDLIDFINDEFYSHDKHNAFLEFTMKSLPTDNIIVLFYFQKTKRYVETKAFVDGDKFTIEFDTSLINTDETVLGFIYFEKVAQSADVHRFSFGVKVSEIDKLHDMPIEEAKTKRVVAVEDIVTKAELDELFKRIEKNGGTYDDTEIRNSISSIEERVQTLEAKPDNDSDVKSRLNALESNASRYLTEHQPLTSIEERIQQVEARFNNLSNIYLTSHQSLDHLATNDALDKLAQRVEQLEQNRGSQPAVDNHDFVTRKELEDKHYLTSVPEEYAKKSDLSTDSELRNKITQLETNSVTKEKVESVENRVLALENKPNAIPQGYDDSALQQRITNLENRPQVDLTDYAKKSEIPNTSQFATTDSVNNLLRTQGEQNVKISALESKSAYEIHGIGMPNGRVTASIGTTYVDMEVTNGALKWIKATGTGNTGWKVVEGDTGWVLGWQYKHDDNKNRMYFRRKNDVVHVKFEPEINDRSISLETNLILNSGGDGFDEPLSIDGFKPIDDIIQTIFKTSNEIYSTTAGAENSEGAQGTGAVMIQYEYQYNYTDKRQDKHGLKLNIVTSELGVAANHVNPFSYFTEDEWPTTLPTL